MKIGAIDLKLKKKATAFANVEHELLQLCYSTCTSAKNKKFRFAKVDNQFAKYLPYLSDGAVKLYLYYAFAAKNEDGGSWHSIETICNNLDVSDRSIVNWNNQLEDLGLVYRTKGSRKSRSTYILPLTSYAIELTTEKLNQIFREVELFEANRYTRAFGVYQTVTKLIIPKEEGSAFNSVICIRLKKQAIYEGNKINSSDVFFYTNSNIVNPSVVERILGVQPDEKILEVSTTEQITLGTKTVNIDKCYFVNEAAKVNEENVLGIMLQLTDEENDTDCVKKL